MKKNLLLFIICALLGAYAYYTQEYKAVMITRESFLPEWEIGNLVMLKNQNISILIREDDYWIPELDVPADPLTTKYVLEMLDQLRVEKRLTPSEVEKVGVDSFFPEKDELTFVFQKSKQRTIVKLKIGAKLNYSRGFYAATKVDDKWNYYILKDHSPLEGIYLEAQHKKSNSQYIKFVGLIHLDERFFLPQTHALFLKGVESIEIRSNVAKPYVIDLKKKTIHPKAFKTVEVSSKKIQNFINNLAKIKVSSVYPIKSEVIQDLFDSQKNFENLKGQLVLGFANKTSLKLKYYQKDNEIIVYSEKWKFAQRYQLNQFSLFLPHHQDFYKKEPFKKFSENKLMEYLRTKANWLGKIDKIDSEYLKNKLSEFKVNGKKFSLFELDKDLVLVDVKENIKYHYYRGLSEFQRMKSSLKNKTK